MYASGTPRRSNKHGAPILSSPWTIILGLMASDYAELNPVRAGLVAEAELGVVERRCSLRFLRSGTWA